MLTLDSCYSSSNISISRVAAITINLWTSIFKVRTTLDDLLRLVIHRSQVWPKLPGAAAAGEGEGRCGRRGQSQAAVRRVFSLRGAGPSCSQCGTQPGSVCLPAARGTVSSIPTHHGYTVTTLPHDFNVDSLTIKLTV